MQIRQKNQAEGSKREMILFEGVLNEVGKGKSDH